MCSKFHFSFKTVHELEGGHIDDFVKPREAELCLELGNKEFFGLEYFVWKWSMLFSVCNHKSLREVWEWGIHSFTV